MAMFDVRPRGLAQLADRLEANAKRIEESLGSWALSVIDAQSQWTGEALEAYLDASQMQLERQRAMADALGEIAVVARAIAKEYSDADMAGQRRFAD
jgi:WXG100 family type VII secretion target